MKRKDKQEEEDLDNFTSKSFQYDLIDSKLGDS